MEADYTLLDGRKVEGLHPDGVCEALNVFLIYSGQHRTGNAHLLDPMAHALDAYRAWEKRQ